MIYTLLKNSLNHLSVFSDKMAEKLHLVYIPKELQTEDDCLDKLNESIRNYVFVRIRTEKLCCWAIDNNKCFAPDDFEYEHMFVTLLTKIIYDKFVNKYGVSIDI